MQMDPGEILRDYNASTNKVQQVSVLAELNAVTPIEIAKLLREQGAELPEMWLKRLAKYDETEARRAVARQIQQAPTAPAYLPEPEQAPPGCITAGVLLELLCRIPLGTPIRVRGSGVLARQMAYTEAYDAETRETVHVLELGGGGEK